MAGNTATVVEMNLDDEIAGYVDKLNYDIGYCFWKRYVYCAFWSNISTPINLAITILTALTTGQSATNSLISESTNTRLGIAALFISIFNTFFRPTQQLNDNTQIKNQWTELGAKFEEIYYNKVYSVEEKKVKLNQLQSLFKENNELKRSNSANYFIDLIFMIAEYGCIRDNIYWIPDDDGQNPNNPLSVNKKRKVDKTDKKKQNKKNEQNSDESNKRDEDTTSEFSLNINNDSNA
jgi:hypothetical protein